MKRPSLSEVKRAIASARLKWAFWFLRLAFSKRTTFSMCTNRKIVLAELYSGPANYKIPWATTFQLSLSISAPPQHTGICCVANPLSSPSAPNDTNDLCVP
jgi:hypothetical protein